MMRFSTVIGLGATLFLIGLVGCGPEATPAAPMATVSATQATIGTEEPPSPRPTETSAPEPTVVPTPTVQPATPTATAAELAVFTDTFEPGGAIPERYTCHSDNVSPSLRWLGAPRETQSLALIVQDPDSSPPGFVHWVVYNIPAEMEGLPEGLLPEPTLPDGILQGKNDFARFGSGTFPGGSPIHQVGYDGPCPPQGEHRYVFTLYALDTMLDLPAEATASEVMSAIEGRLLAQAELVGVYTAP